MSLPALPISNCSRSSSRMAVLAGTRTGIAATTEELQSYQRGPQLRASFLLAPWVTSVPRIDDSTDRSAANLVRPRMLCHRHRERRSYGASDFLLASQLF